MGDPYDKNLKSKILNQGDLRTGNTIQQHVQKIKRGVVSLQYGFFFARIQA